MGVFFPPLWLRKLFCFLFFLFSSFSTVAGGCGLRRKKKGGGNIASGCAPSVVSISLFQKKGGKKILERMDVGKTNGLFQNPRK